MPDPTPPNPEKPTRKSPSPLDEKLLAQLGKDEEIIRAVIDEIGRDPSLAADLATHALDADGAVPINPANLEQLSRDAVATRETAAAATSRTADLRGVTTVERGHFEKAIAAIRSVQTRAKEKYEEKQPEKLAAYYIGQPLGSRQQIADAGGAIWSLVGDTDAAGQLVTPPETLPGLNAARLAQLKTDLGEFAAIQTQQSGAQSTATQVRGNFKDQCEQISRRRRRVQLAIDAERPHGPNNSALRRRLGLPTDKSMS